MKEQNNIFKSSLLAVLTLLIATLFSFNYSFTSIKVTVNKKSTDSVFTSAYPDGNDQFFYIGIEENEEDDDQQELENSIVSTSTGISLFPLLACSNEALKKVFIYRNFIISYCCLKIPDLV